MTSVAAPIRSDRSGSRAGETQPTRPGRPGRRFWLSIGLVVAMLLPPAVATDLPWTTRLTMSTFAAMLVCSGFTKVSELRLALGTVGALVVVGSSSPGDVLAETTSDTVWLLVGAFVIAAGAKRSGLAERMAERVTGPAADVTSLFTRVSLMLVATSFLVPSTAGRAALMVPVFQAISQQIPQASIRRALAVLFPVNILLSAVASLLGAGAHIVTAELVTGLGGQQLDLVRWTVLGLPFALASCLVAQLVITRMFVDRADRSAAISLTTAARTPMSPVQRLVAGVLAVTVVLWMTEPIHGVSLWLPAVLGALAVVAPRLGVVSIGDGLRAIPFDLLALMIATVEVGKALARSGAADWIAASMLQPVLDVTGSSFAVVTMVVLLSLLAHLVITSRTARASVLIPVVVLIGGAAGIDITAIAFLSAAAAGYCLSSTTSAKPMMVFSRVEDTYAPTDLKRLSVLLLPVHVGLLLGFAYIVWPALGMPLQASAAVAAGEAEVVGPAESDERGRHPSTELHVDDLTVGPRIDVDPRPTDRSGVVNTGETADESMDVIDESGSLTLSTGFDDGDLDDGHSDEADLSSRPRTDNNLDETDLDETDLGDTDLGEGDLGEGDDG